MRIEPGAIYSRYQAYTPAGAGKAEIPAAPQAAPARENAGKTDVVSISGAAARESAIGRMTQNIAAELETSASAPRLKALQDKVQSGEYFVSSQELARAMLGLRG